MTMTFNLYVGALALPENDQRRQDLNNTVPRTWLQRFPWNHAGNNDRGCWLRLDLSPDDFSDSNGAVDNDRPTPSDPILGEGTLTVMAGWNCG